MTIGVDKDYFLVRGSEDDLEAVLLESAGRELSSLQEITTRMEQARSMKPQLPREQNRMRRSQGFYESRHTVFAVFIEAEVGVLGYEATRCVIRETGPKILRVCSMPANTV